MLLQMYCTLKDPFKRLKSNIPYPFLSATWITPFGWNFPPVAPLQGVPSVYELITG